MKPRFKIIKLATSISLIVGFNLQPIFQNKVNSKEEIPKSSANKTLTKEYLRRFPNDNYILDTGDTLTIDISREYPELKTSVFIDGEGKIDLPLINRVYVRGLTLEEMNNILNEEYLNYIIYPEVKSSIVKYKDIKVLVDGAVNNPGMQTLTGSFSSGELYYFPKVFDAIRVAGGINQFSDIKNITLIRKNTITNGGGKIITTLNFEEIEEKYSSAQNIRVYDGDIINVEKLKEPNDKFIGSAIKSNLSPRFINVLITGRVNAPGQLKLGRSGTLNDALDLAGGAKFVRGKIRHISLNNDGTIKKNTIKYSRKNKRGSKNNPYLNDGDIIFVGQSFISSSSEVLKEITDPFLGIYSTYSLIEALTD